MSLLPMNEWPTTELVYTAIVGFVMLMALVEWILWLTAFIYCLYKVFRKADHWSIKVLSVFVAGAFLLLRGIFLPIMLVTLPLPDQITRMWSKSLVAILQWFAFGAFAIALTVPWMFCIHQLATKQLVRQKQNERRLDSTDSPKIVVVMPCYNEEFDVLISAVNSVVNSDYPATCVHLFLSFNGDMVDRLYLDTIGHLGVSLPKTSYPVSIDVVYRQVRLTISRFPHGGKRCCQKRTFKLVDQLYGQYSQTNGDVFMLFIDSDCILDASCIRSFVYDMELSPGNRKDTLAMTGIITATTKKHSMITLLQDLEYIHGQLFERAVESACGAVTCLPGALTMVRYAAFRRMSKYYFGDESEKCEDLFDFAKCHLGEDRWLTHLFMIGAKKRYQIQLCTSAFCKTEAVQTYRSLVKQRRRWFMGFITNEACMLTDWRLWKRYPILIVIRFMQNTIRTTTLLFFIIVIALATTTVTVEHLPIGFIAISFGLNWLLMFYFGAKLRRFKIWLYPIMFVLSPFFNWYYMVYGILTAGRRTWGGPRADAAAADMDCTAEDAIHNANRQDGDPIILPASFTNCRQASIIPPKFNASDEPDLGRTYSLLQPPKAIDGILAEQLRPMPFTELRYQSADGDIMENLISCDFPSEGEYAATISWAQMEECMNDEDRLKYKAALRMQQE